MSRPASARCWTRALRLRSRAYPTPGLVASSGRRCSSEAPREFSHVDHNPGMRAGPDLLDAIGRSDGEFDLPSVDLRHLGLRGDKTSNGCSGEMAYVDGRADCALAGIEIGPDCIKCGVFHGHDHH